MPRLQILLALFLWTPLAAAHAQQYAPDARVDSVFAAYDRTDAPGCAVGVYQDGRIRYARGYGLADLERRVPISPATVFDIGSTSKQFTAATILLLEQEGRLSLDDDVRRFLPELPVYDRPITVRHLLHHTSGLRDYIGLLQLAGVRYDDVATADDALQMLIRQRALNFAPGDEHLYSNSGYFLLSLIVERATGRSLRDEARDRIFAPLHMTRTAYLGSYDDVVPDRAIGYAPRDSGFRADMPRWLQLGDGAVLTTVEDLLHWGENFRTTQVGGATMRDALLTRGRLTSGKELDYALGLRHGEHRGLATVFHGGSWGGYVAEFLRVPEERYGVAVLCNREDASPSALALKVAEIHLADQMDPLPAPEAVTASGASTPPAENAVKLRPLKTYAGTYRAGNTGNVVAIAVEGDALRVLEPRRYDLIARGPDEFALVGTPVSIHLVFAPGETADALAPQLTEMVNGAARNVYLRITDVPLTPASAAAYAGRYYSPELATSLVVAASDTGLSVVLRNASPEGLRAGGADEFFGGGLNLEFTRDAGGEVSGLLLSQGRARGMRFDRAAPEP
jgi:CubicO group peptidase (beta-lactamase class C family)